jgi:cupin 2 domain-containing protein
VTANMNLLENLPTELPEEVAELLVADRTVRIERIVSHGHSSEPGFWYDQAQHEWVLLLQGAARLKFKDNDQMIAMRAGDSLNIPAHRLHRVEWTTSDQPTIWLAVHYGNPPNA